MLNIFKYHKSPEQLESFEAHLKQDPSLISGFKINDSPEMLKFVLGLLDEYTNKYLPIIATLITNKYYSQPIIDKISAISRNYKFEYEDLFKLMLKQGEPSKLKNFLLELISDSTYKTINKLIPTYIEYTANGDSTKLTKLLMLLLPNKHLNTYNLIEAIKEISHDPNIFNQIYSQFGNMDLSFKLEVHPTYDNKEIADIRLEPNVQVYQILQIYDKLPIELHKSIIIVLKKEISKIDTKLSKLLSGGTYKSFKFESDRVLEQVSHLTGTTLEKTKNVLGTMYHQLNSRESMQQINALSGKEQQDAMKNHGIYIKNILDMIMKLK